MYLKIVLNWPSWYFMRKCRFYHLFLYKSFIKNLMENFKNSNCYHKTPMCILPEMSRKTQGHKLSLYSYEN